MRLILTILMLTSTVSFAVESKVGLVDLERAMLLTADGQKAKKTLEGEMHKREEILQKMNRNMRRLNDEFEHKAAMLAQSAREKQALQLQQEMRKYQDALNQNQNEMAKLQHDLLRPIEQKMNTIITELAKKEGYSMIVNRVNELVLYSASQIDLTDRVAEAYNHG